MAKRGKQEPLGPRGESLAARFLEGIGYRILARNYRAPGGEVDVVAADGDDIVFVEVKTFTGSEFGEPAERVESGKQRRLGRAALFYLQERRLEGASFRFDVVAICMDAEPRGITHFPDAFELHPSFRV